MKVTRKHMENYLQRCLDILTEHIKLILPGHMDTVKYVCWWTLTRQERHFILTPASAQLPLCLPLGRPASNLITQLMKTDLGI